MAIDLSQTMALATELTTLRCLKPQVLAWHSEQTCGARASSVSAWAAGLMGRSIFLGEGLSEPEAFFKADFVLS